MVDSLGRKRMTAAERDASLKRRLLAGVTIDGAGCWIWKRPSPVHGYGNIGYGGKKHLRTHRAAYTMFVGPIPDGMCVCHRCDVPACCNPEHLFLGTQAENMADMVRKGKFRNRPDLPSKPKAVRPPQPMAVRGPNRNAAKLTPDQVREILASTESSRTLAKRLPVGDCMVRRIRRGLAWSVNPNQSPDPVL